MSSENTPRSNTADSDSVFETGERTVEPTSEKYHRLIDEFVLAPIRILWGDWRALIGASIVIFYFLMGTVGVFLIPAPEPNQGPTMLAPFQNWQFPLGTSGSGQDILASVVHATPSMLKMIGAGALFATIMGTAVGTTAGLMGGKIDTALSIIMDALVAIPGLPLVIVLSAVINPENPYLVGVLLTVNVWAGTGRAIRSEVLTLRSSEYVEAAQIMGIKTPSIIFKDVLPNIMSYVLVKFVNTARFVVFSSVGLYFLGVLPFSTVNWGVMMNLAYKSGGIYLGIGLHWILAPMVAIITLTLGLILLTQSLDRIFNPRTRARHAKTVDDTGGSK